jgi:hypothetical protein
MATVESNMGNKQVSNNRPKQAEPAGVRAARVVPRYARDHLGFFVQAGEAGLGQGAPVPRTAMVGLMVWGCVSFKPGVDSQAGGWRYVVTPEGCEVYEGLLALESGGAVGP